MAARKLLFITADQWRGELLSCLGHPVVRTPNIDRLAAGGTLFSRCFAQSAPCGPARASLYTGMYLHNHRAVRNGTPLDRRHDNLALALRRGGLDPVLFGYTDIAPDPRGLDPKDPVLFTYEGVLEGFRAEVPLAGRDLTAWLGHLRRKGYDLPSDPTEMFLPAEGLEPANTSGCGQLPARYGAEDSISAFLTDGVIDYVTRRQKEPWAVYLSLLAPHTPWVAPAPYHARYDPEEIALPPRAPTIAEAARQHPWLAKQLERGYNFTWPAGANRDMSGLTAAEIREVTAVYYGLLSEVDDQIGRLLAALAKSGQFEDTLIIFTSDHGTHLGDHWMFEKGGYFDQSYHIPLILSLPGASGAGRQVSAFAEAVDILPTILDWLDLEAPAQCDGRSLLPFCRGETPADWRKAVHWEYDFRDIVSGKFEEALGLNSDDCWLAVRRGERSKYVHFAGLPPLYFDLEADPWETRNLAGDPAYGARVLQEAQGMLSWLMSSAERGLTRQLVTPQGLVEAKA